MPEERRLVLLFKSDFFKTLFCTGHQYFSLSLKKQKYRPCHPSTCFQQIQEQSPSTLKQGRQHTFNVNHFSHLSSLHMWQQKRYSPHSSSSPQFVSPLIFADMTPVCRKPKTIAFLNDFEAARSTIFINTVIPYLRAQIAHMKHPPTEFNSVNSRLMTNAAHAAGDAGKSTVMHPGTLAEGSVGFHLNHHPANSFQGCTPTAARSPFKCC